MSLSHGDPGNGESAVDIVLSTSMLEGSLSGAGVVTRGIGLGGLSGSPIEILQQSTQALPRRQQQQSDEEDERVAGSPRVTRVRGLFD